MDKPSETPIKQRLTIGLCTLYLADVREMLDAIEPYNSIASDPPYGLKYQSNFSTDELWGTERTITGDEDTSSRDYIIERSAGRPCLMFGTWKIARHPHTRQVLIWDKGGALGMGATDIPWKPDHEEIYVIGKGFIGTRDRGSVIHCPPVQSTAKNGRKHPNQKPVQLMQELCRKLPGVIFDPFMGSGSTGVACAQMRRPFIGVEVVPDFFNIAVQRINAAYDQFNLFSSEDIND